MHPIPNQDCTRMVQLLMRMNPGSCMTAAAIAERLRLGGTREARRRTVRRMAERARALGERVCALPPRTGTCGGYFIAADDAEWTAYLSYRRTADVGDLVRLREMRRTSSERVVDQRTLFPVHKIDFASV